MKIYFQFLVIFFKGFPDHECYSECIGPVYAYISTIHRAHIHNLEPKTLEKSGVFMNFWTLVNVLKHFSSCIDMF